MQEKADSSSNSVILVHWEPEAYNRYPSGRERETIPEIATAALTHREVYAKDTDLILNRRIVSTLSDPFTFSVFSEFVRLGLLKILLRPVRDSMGTGLDQEEHPILLRALNIRTLGAESFTPTEEQTTFYRSLDHLLCSVPRSTRPVNTYPESINPFARWLAYLLERREALNTFPDFAGIDARLADLFIQFCREPGAWLEYYRTHAPSLLRPGDEDGKFFRSQAYRSLEHLGIPEHHGMKNLLQSVFNACYCYWEGAVGTFVSGHLLEPPAIGGRAETYSNDTLSLLQVAKTSTLASPRLADVVCRVRQSRSRAFDDLQAGLLRMKRCGVAEPDMHDLVQRVAEEFTSEAHRLHLVPQGLDARAWTVNWSVIAGLSTIAWAVNLQPVMSGVVSGIAILAVAGPVIVEQILQRKTANEMSDALRFRASHFEIPQEVAALKEDSALKAQA